jgi:alpha-tubulin suppressor-like RCC1 family protein
MKMKSLRHMSVVTIIFFGINFALPGFMQVALAAVPVTVTATGSSHSLAIKLDGTVWSWGDNTYGELGDGTNDYQYSPILIPGLTGVTAISAGYLHSMALKSDGTVWAWGWNAQGQLGNGTEIDSNVPVEVSGLTDVIAIDASRFHSLALKSDGTVWAWGQNTEGQLGDGTETNSSTPVQVITGLGGPALTGVIAIDGGGYHSLALKSDHTVWAWGMDGYGQVDGTLQAGIRDYPVQVPGISGITAISGGFNHSLALKSDGTVWAWGLNGTLSGGDEYGMRGNGTTTHTIAGVNKVLGAGGSGFLTDVIAIGAGQQGSQALKSDGTVWAWGRNYIGGEFGNGTYDNSAVPMQTSNVDLASSVTAFSVGENETLALKSDGTVWAWGYPNYAFVPSQVYFAEPAPNDCTFIGAAGGGDNTSFSDALNWETCNDVSPQSTDNAIIPGGFDVVLDAAQILNHLEVDDTSSLDLVTHSLTVSTEVNNFGTINVGSDNFNVYGTLINNTTGIVNGETGTVNVVVELDNYGIVNVNSATINMSGDNSYWYNEGTFNGNSGTINVSGDSSIWYNLGAFDGGTGTVNFNGTNQWIYGNTTFNNLTKETAVADSLFFDDTSTQTVTGTLTLNGASGNLLSLLSATPDSQWTIAPTGNRSISYVDVKDSNNTDTGTPILAGTGGVDSGNNLYWDFSGAGGGSSASSNSNGNIDIGCDATGSISLTAPTAITFDTKTTDFYNDSDASAVSVPGDGVDASHLKITDTRGYDAGAGSELTCGNGFTLSVESNGLQLYNVDNSDFDIQLGLGTASSAWTEGGSSSPTTLLGNVVHASSSNDSLITTSKDLVTSEEAFSGNVSLELSGGVLKAPAATAFGMRAADLTNPELNPFATWDYTSAIPTGNYTGTITFTLS